MANLDYAIAYSRLGWAVFPCHTIINGACSCKKTYCESPGKHPIASLVPSGHNQASTEEVLINSWWAAHPDANIGIATGKASGLLVIDIDIADAIPQGVLPDTVEQITGSGGRHLLYKRPDDDARYLNNTSTAGIKGVDSRADGGYIIAPPSLHKSGKRYQWEGSSDPLEGIRPVDAPAWWIDAIKTKNPAYIGSSPTWHPEMELPDDLAAMLDHIQAEDYQTWIKVGMALHHASPNEGLSWWDWWSSSASNYSADSVASEWRNFSRKAHKAATIVTIRSIERMASENGYIDSRIGEGEAIIASLELGEQEKIANALIASDTPQSIVFRPTIMPKHGMIRDIARYITATARWPQEDLAIANAIAFIGAVAGRKYQTAFGGYSNIYAVGLLDSGGGKDHSRKIITKIAVAAGASEYLGGENFASGQSVISALQRNPAQLFQVDEFGKFVSAAASGNASAFLADIITKLMILYSSAGGIYQGTEYADQKTRPRIIIDNPCACVYGTSTPSSFWGGLSSAETVDGFLSRLLIVDAVASYRGKLQTPSLAPIPQGIIDYISTLANKVTGGGNLDGDPITVPMTAEVIVDIDRLEHHLTEKMQSSAERSIYSRVVEQGLKLALIYAVSLNTEHPTIDAEAWEYGREFAFWSANQLANRVKDTIADTPFEAACKATFLVIKAAKKQGISTTELAAKCSKYRASKSRDRAEILQTLMDDRNIVCTMQPSKTKTTKIYFAL